MLLPDFMVGRDWEIHREVGPAEGRNPHLSICRWYEVSGQRFWLEVRIDLPKLEESACVTAYQKEEGGQLGRVQQGPVLTHEEWFWLASKFREMPGLEGEDIHVPYPKNLIFTPQT